LHRQSFEGLAAYFAFFDYVSYTLMGNGEPERLSGVGVSQNFFALLGIEPSIGRGFVDEECKWNGSRAVILSHSYWQKLTESILLACCGAAAGLPLAFWATRGLAATRAVSIPLLQTASIDGRALIFTLVVAVSTGLLFGIVPALQISRAKVLNS
jgi:ABC-type phosphate/phosphonate transport system permease subunit